ncbi:MAG TPA: CHRD domain-containing protein [Novosphingobium sp.]|nr:CHRD domain-containing protein [Novosphingobium sp.]
MSRKPTHRSFAAGALSGVAALALALAAMPGPARAAPATLTAALSGSAETRGGDPDGSGGFRVELDPDTNDFCYALWVDKLARPTMAHVHSGPAGSDGAARFTLTVTGKNNDMCIAIDRDKLQPLVDNPADYYIDVHTAAHPDGAVRGQLAKE